MARPVSSLLLLLPLLPGASLVSNRALAGHGSPTAGCSAGPSGALVAEGEDIFVSASFGYSNGSGGDVTYTTTRTEIYTPPGGAPVSTSSSSTRVVGADLGVSVAPLSGPSTFPAGRTQVSYTITSSGTGSTVLASCGYDVTAIPTNSLVDTDGDALYDIWETSGLDLDADGTVDFTLPGADPNRADLYLEIDCLADDGNNDGDTTDSGDHSHCPPSAVIDDVVDAFAEAPWANPDGTTGIQLHIDVGTLFGAGTTSLTGSGGVTGVYGDLGGGGDIIDEAGNTVIDFDGATGNPGTSIYTLKASSFDTDRAFTFRYAIFGHQTNGRAAVNDCTSGWAEGIPGNDFFVTLGGVGGGGGACWNTDANGFSVGSQAQQAGTLMHEFGHTIGLSHGGGDGVNNKPNFLSVMNYSFQMCTVPASPDGSQAGGCDFSIIDLPDLDETSLDECVGLGGLGYGAFDWDGDGSMEGSTTCQPGLDTNVAADINGDAACVTAGANGTLDSTAGNDDNTSGSTIFDGPDRVCDTTTVPDDRQRRGPGSVQPNPLASWDDWSGIVFNFREVPEFANGVSSPVEEEADPTDIEVAREHLAELTAPFIELGKTGPTEAYPEDLLSFTLRVSNTGAGPALDVVALDGLPDGTELAWDLGAVTALETVEWMVDWEVPADWCPQTATNTLGVSWLDMTGEEGFESTLVETEILDGTPPEVVVAAPLSLWPPRHDLYTFSLSDCVESVVDSCDGELDPDVYGTILSISSDEPEDARGGGDGSTSGDIAILDDVSFQVRAERSGSGNGRVYTVSFEVADTSGNATPASCTIEVPKSSSGTAIDDGASGGYTIN